MYSRKLPLFAFVLTLAGILFLTAFRSADAIKEGQPSQTNAPLLGASHEPVLLPDPIGAMRLVAVDVADNLRRTPTTLDWRKAEGPTHKSLDFFKLMREQTKVPDSILHDLRLIGGWGRCNQSLGIDHAGTQGLLMPNGVTHAACNLVTLMDTFQFKVYDYAMFPFLASTNSSEGHNAAFETMKGRVAIGINSYYLLLGTQINPADKSVIFRVAVNLPKEGIFNEVDATIEELIVADVTEAMNLEFDGANSVTSIYAAEVAGMEKMKEIIEALIGGTYYPTLSKSVLEKLGFFPVLGNSGVISRTGITEEEGNIIDFAGISSGGGSIVPQIADDLTKLFSRLPLSFKVIITDNLCYSDSSGIKFSLAQLSYGVSTEKFVFWLHYFSPDASNQNGWVYMKAKANDLSAAETDLALQKFWHYYRNPPSARGNGSNADFSSCPNYEFSSSWRIRDNLLDCIETQIPLLAFVPDFLIGYCAGFVDKALDEICFFYEVANGLVDFARYTYPVGNGYVSDSLIPLLPGGEVFMGGWALDVFWRTAKRIVVEKEYNIFNWGVQYNIAVGENMRDAEVFWSKVRKIYKLFTDKNEIGKLLNEMWISLKESLDDIAGSNGSKIQGYIVGGVVFDLVFEVVTLGTATYFALGREGMEAVGEAISRKIVGSQLIRGGIDKMGDVFEKFKCKILSFGCFAAGVSVATAAGNVPIELLTVNLNTELSFKKPNALEEYIQVYSEVDTSVIASGLSIEGIHQEEITPETWKWVFLNMIDEGGSHNFTAKLRRPNWWLKKYSAEKAGDVTWLSFPDLGISGTAIVTDVLPSFIDTRFPQINLNSTSQNTYCPITGWFEGVATETWDYVFSNQDTISATPNHPLFSKEKQIFVPVGNLEIGESIMTALNEEVCLIEKKRRSCTEEKVYNIEVWESGNFIVGKDGFVSGPKCMNDLEDLLEKTITQTSKGAIQGLGAIDSEAYKELLLDLGETVSDGIGKRVDDLTPDLVEAWKEVKHLPDLRKDFEFIEAFNRIFKNPAAKKHIFEGEINLAGKGIGVHHKIAVDNGTARIRPGTDITVGPNGLYQAFVDVADASGGWAAKDAKSTFFPDDWSPGKVMEEIGFAYKNKVFKGGNTFEATSIDGTINIRMFLTPDKTIISSFPFF